MDSRPSGESLFGKGFDQTFERCRQEADEFYQAIAPPGLSSDGRMVMRQALAGMLWSKQYYYFDIERWLEEHREAHWVVPSGRRNSGWAHMLNDDVISMPDKWEYPWYAAWDLAFHAVAIAVVDMDFAKAQLLLMLNEMYQRTGACLRVERWGCESARARVGRFLHLPDRETSNRGRRHSVS